MEVNYIVFFDSIGIIAFTLSGYILASKKEFDLFGILFISFTTAFAGGIFRDLITNRVPFIFQESYPLSISIITLLIGYTAKLHNRLDLSDSKIFLLSDSIGLSVFALSGALSAVDSKFNFGGIVFLALITAVGGSITRDIIMNKVPYFFTNEFYGSVAILIGVLVWVFSSVNLISNITIILILILGFFIRIMAIKYKWKLPNIIIENKF